jgi:hypothetical protein
MESENASVLLPVALTLWVVLAIASTAFFHLIRDAKLKQAVFPFAAIGAGLLFLGFLFFIAPLGVVAAAVPFVVLVTWIRLRSIRFCMSCGKTSLGQNVIFPSKFCPSCGAQLVEKIQGKH